MKPCLPFLLTLAVAAHAGAVTLENPSVRVETTGSTNAASLRLSVRDGGRWRTLLRPAKPGSGRAVIPTLSGRLGKTTGKRILLQSGPAGRAVSTEITLGPAAGQVHVVSRLRLVKATPVETVSAAWSFVPDGRPGRPDLTWTPNLRPNEDEVIGQHVFRSPGALAQQGKLAAIILPDLDVLDANWKALPATLSLDVRDPAGPRLEYALQEHHVVRHVYWSHPAGRTKTIGPGTVTMAYDILLSANEAPRQSYRRVARWWWEKEGHRNLGDALPQAVPWDTYARTGIDRYMLPVAWREATMDGATVGGVAMNTWGMANATWFQCWFNDLRSAYGTYLWGKQMDRPDLLEKARQTRELLLHSPQKEGLFPVIYDWDAGKWIGSTAGGGPDIYHVADCAWAAYWLLMWNHDLEKSPESIAFARRLGDYLVQAQAEDGNLPAYVQMQTMQPTPRLATGAEAGAGGMFLAFLGRETGDARYLAAARKVAGYIRHKIWPTNRWFDYETFYSCSGKPETFFDSITGQNPQNNLSISWASELFRQLYLADHDRQDLADGAAILDYLNLYQQVWSPSYLTFAGYGGYGVQNTDAEWDDARQAQFACTNLDYYLLTKKPEYLERGIAAMRAGFATVYMPENAFVSPRTYNKQPLGYADENYGHGGVDAAAGPTSWDWGTGSALTSAAYGRKLFGDVWVDGNAGRAYGVDGVTAIWTKETLTVRSSLQTLAPVTVRGTGRNLPSVWWVNGKRVSISPEQWRDGFKVTPVAAPRVRHRAPAILSADAAKLPVEVWPRGSAKALRLTARTALGTTTLRANGNANAITLPASLFRTGAQPVSYTIEADGPGGTSRATYETTVFAFGPEQPVWSDVFQYDAALDPRWQVETPAAGADARKDGAALRLSVPGVRSYDQWLDADAAPRVMTAAPSGDWAFTVRIFPGDRPERGNAQAGITVGFGGRDFAFFGPFQGNTVTLERTGQNGLGSAPLPAGSDPLDLRVRRVKDTLWFDWRPAGGAWQPPVLLQPGAAPARVGMFLKTWEPMAASVAFESATLSRPR